MPFTIGPPITSMDSAAVDSISAATVVTGSRRYLQSVRVTTPLANTGSSLENP